ncbi:P-loop containing nucleoside triphosphate hydrolase protein [Amanita muscaria]
MDVDTADENEPSESVVDVEEQSQSDVPAEDSTTLQPALPTFPLPAPPNAPSKAELALQGLDQALIEAELIDSSYLLRVPSQDEEDVLGLGGKMKKRLKELGIQEFFAVQASLLPYLLKNNIQSPLYMPYDPPRDVCVSAPTGSGKTLAYAIPIVEILSSRVVTRLRALIVLPTRDLVTQVRETFELISKGRGLKIGSVTGQHSFAHEQSHLVADQSPHICGGSSKVDVLICTPGRLMDHLNGTPNFSLQHLRFLVIDEADRLLAQSFQDWLAQVLAATRPPSSKNDVHVPTVFTYPVIDSVSPPYSCLLPLPQLPCNLTEKKESSCQKLLFSATLTRDPGKIAALGLREPKYFNVQDKIMPTNEAGSLSDMMERFSMPTTLRVGIVKRFFAHLIHAKQEHMVVCESSLKPLVFFHLVHAHSMSSALVFAKSTESTTRLVQLFEYFEESRAPDVRLSVCAYSSDLPASDRKSILEKFKTQEIQILVCSDLISRGIDIQHVSHVVSYDAPIDMRKYVHRVGRTARAGRAGDAWTLVEEQEVKLISWIGALILTRITPGTPFQTHVARS